jgi:hypothetical protein
VKVASTIGQGLVDTHFVSTTTLLAALLAAIAWNLLDVVAGPAVKFEPCADWRALRRHLRHRRQ